MGRSCPDPEAAALFETIRRAYVDNDHAAHGSAVSDGMRLAVPAERLAALAVTMGPLLSDPARLSYMDGLKEGEHVVHFWKVDSGASRDVLIRMGVKDGRVSGLLFSAPFDTGSREKA